MKQLFIAEKSSAGKDIAKVLGLTSSDMKDGYMENDKYIVGWARGHLVGIKDAKELYDNAWSGENLPFKIDIEKDLKVINEKGSLGIFNTLKMLINRDDVSLIVNAGDSGREGELIQQWIYKMCKNKKPIKRLWTSSLTDESIKKAINTLKPNEDYKNLYEEGKALKIIDWMYGMSYTVLLTKIFGNGELLVYGRCKTPLLYLIVERENEIKNFTKEKYYLNIANFNTYKGTEIVLNSETKKYENKVLKFANEEEKNQYLERFEKISDCNAIIKDYKSEEKETKCPRCFSLTTLQQTLGKKYGYTPDKTLELAQSLYEKKYTTYPRTNSEYLTDDIWSEKDKHINSCIDNLKSYLNIEISPDKAKAKNKDYVDNSKVEDHHAIIPTEIKADISTLNEEEKNAYFEICKRFISIFMMPYKYNSTQIITDVYGEALFKTTGTKDIDLGFKILYKKDEKDEDAEDEENQTNLPIFKVGDKVNAIPTFKFNLKECETKPKSRYNVASIIKVMEQYRIGTPATQAGIIEETLNQKVIEIVSKGKKKEYKPTEKGEQLIKLIPEELKTPDLCKRVEERIKEVGKGNLKLYTLQEEIYKEQEETMNKLKESAKSGTFSFSLTKKEPEVICMCPFCGKEIVERKDTYSHKDWKDNPCKFTIFKNSLYTSINCKMAKELMTTGITIGSFKSKEGKPYKQQIILNKETKKLEKGEYINKNNN